MDGLEPDCVFLKYEYGWATVVARSRLGMQGNTFSKGIFACTFHTVT